MSDRSAQDKVAGMLSYLPADRRLALTRGATLPEWGSGATLFADLSGFTPATVMMTRVYGAYRGAEEMLGLLNAIYSALLAAADRLGGSTIGFAGDAITISFDDDAPQAAEGTPAASGVERAATCAFVMQEAMAAHREVRLPGGEHIALDLKVTVVAGPARRLLVGDPDLYLLETVAGATIVRLGVAANATRNGEVVLDAAAAALLGARVTGEWREAGGERLLVARALRERAAPRPWPPDDPAAVGAAQVRPWLLPPVYERLADGQSEFLAELRTTISLFVRFADLDYDHDEGAGARLDHFVRWVQRVTARFTGWLIQLSIGDKGSYLYITFGAPVALGDDANRAAAAALALCDLPPDLAHMGPLQIGIAGGQSRAGAMGGSTRTYNVMGEATNLAARLMSAARDGQVLMAANLAPAVSRRYALEPLPPIQAKGLGLVHLVAVRSALPGELALLEPQYGSPLVGRAAERARLAAEVAAVRGGQGRVVAVVGEAGVGKSRLLGELALLAAQAGFAAFGGVALATGAQTGYQAWQPLWRTFFGLDAADPPDAQAEQAARALAAAGPELLPRLPLLGPALGLELPENDLTRGLDARQRREALAALLVACLRARLGRPAAAPLLLVMEDAHWLSPLSLDLLAALSRAIDGLPVLLAVAYRTPAEGAPAPVPVDQLPHAAAVSLDRLDAAAAAELAAQRLAAAFPEHPEPPERLIAALVARSEGNPFYIEELINYLRDRGALPDDLAAFERLELPASIAAIILSRVDRLSSAQQTTLKVASVIGRVFAVGWLWGVHAQLGAAEEVRRDLVTLSQLDVTPLDAAEPELRYMFKHATMQEVIYESIPFGQREALHANLAGWLEARPEEASVDVLAFHFGRSADVARQRHYFLAAARAAEARYDYQVAAHYYERLLPLLGEHERVPVLLALGEVLYRSSAWEPAGARLAEAHEQAVRLGDAAAEARSALWIGKNLVGRWSPREAAGWFERARLTFSALGDRDQAQLAQRQLAMALWMSRDLDQARELLEANLAEPGVADDPATRAEIFFVLGNIASSRGDMAGATDWWQRSLELRRRLDNPAAVALSLGNLAVAALFARRLDEAEALSREATALFQRVGARREYAMARDILALVLAASGRFDEARSWLFRNLRLYRELGSERSFGVCLLGLAEVVQQSTADHATAVTLASLCMRLHAFEDAPPLPQTQARAQAIRQRAEAAGADGLDAAWEAGQALTWPQAIVYVLGLEHAGGA